MASGIIQSTAAKIKFCKDYFWHRFYLMYRVVTGEYKSALLRKFLDKRIGIQQNAKCKT